jgi:protein phosphatase
MRLDIAAQTDVGRRKQVNEDSLGVFQEDTPGLQFFQEGALLCVADGLGGHGGGEIASRLAVSIVRDLAKEPRGRSGEGLEDPLGSIRGYMEQANRSIWQTNQDNVLRDPNKKPMGTTLLTCLIEPGVAWVGNVGDSRCYVIRDGHILHVTEDHSWVDEQVKLGLMSKAEAKLDRRKNVVTRCVGTHEETTVDTYRWELQPGDMVLLCSDGLVGMATDEEILKVFRKQGAAADIAHTLVNLANENGGKDNITVIVASVSPSPIRLIYLRTRNFLQRKGVTIFTWLALLIYGLAAGTAGFFLHKFLPEIQDFLN